MMKKVLAAAATATMIAGAALAAAPAAPAATAASPASTVDAWYGHFLGREADAGSRYWVKQIEAGARASDQIWAITHSDEYNREDIAAYYAFYLSREPDVGVRYWQQGANAQRFPLEWVEQNVAASPEAVAAANRRGDGDLIQTWYYGALGAGGTFRFPDQGEVAYWNARVRAIGALGAYRELYYTPEAVTARITNWYARLLGRKPSAGEVAYWYPKEVESDINVGVLIASTPEYADLAD